jgi:hypothetical protein
MKALYEDNYHICDISMARTAGPERMRECISWRCVKYRDRYPAAVSLRLANVQGRHIDSAPTGSAI